jgi:hypothetical protein
MAVFVSSGRAQHDEEEDEPLRAGLIATISEGGNEFRRLDSKVAFHEDDRASRRGSVGPARHVTWRGYLMSQAPGEYHLSVYARGKFAVRLRGGVILEAESELPRWYVARAVELSYDWHPLEVGFQPTAGPGQIALFWSGPGFGLEPIPPGQFFHNREQTPDDSHERGRALVRSLLRGLP